MVGMKGPKPIDLYTAWLVPFTMHDFRIYHERCGTMHLEDHLLRKMLMRGVDKRVVYIPR